MKLRALLAASVVALAACATATPASAEWRVIGVRDVRDRTDRDTIVVEGPRQFERIKLCVYRNPVHFLDVDVRFANGGIRTSACASGSIPANARARLI